MPRPIYKLPGCAPWTQSHQKVLMNEYHPWTLYSEVWGGYLHIYKIYEVRWYIVWNNSTRIELYIAVTDWENFTSNISKILKASEKSGLFVGVGNLNIWKITYLPQSYRKMELWYYVIQIHRYLNSSQFYKN